MASTSKTESQPDAVRTHLAAKAGPARLPDAQALVELMARVTGEPPTM